MTALQAIPFIDSTFLVDVAKSLILLLSLLIVRILLVRSIKKHPHLAREAKLRWVVTIRNGMVSVFAVGLIFIWAHELQAFAVSLVAIAVALVLATKELILCMSGAALRMGAGVYSIGDRIQIAGYRGIVMDQDLFTTTLLEIGPGQAAHLITGRMVVFPNSLLFTNPLTNESYTKQYVLDVMTVPLTREEDWQRAEEILLAAAKTECAPYLEEAQRYMRALEQKSILETPSLDPRVTVQIPEPGRLHLLLRFPAPTRGRSRVEQAILRRYLVAAKTTT
ncbi:MAG: mechanosensitive ion channel family protein [Nitrospiraceae bacterium]